MRLPGKVSLDRIEQKLNDLEQMEAVMPETLYLFITDLRSRSISSILKARLFLIVGGQDSNGLNVASDKDYAAHLAAII